jgi:hypothetical protein
MKRKPERFELRNGNFRMIVDNGKVDFPTWEPAPADLIIINGTVQIKKEKENGQKPKD